LLFYWLSRWVQMVLFWVVTPLVLREITNLSEERTCHLHFRVKAIRVSMWWGQIGKLIKPPPNKFGLEMGAACSSETLVSIYRITQCYIPENWYLTNKSYLWKLKICIFYNGYSILACSSAKIQSSLRHWLIKCDIIKGY
jgi:hypothetical protein